MRSRPDKGGTSLIRTAIVGCVAAAAGVGAAIAVAAVPTQLGETSSMFQYSMAQPVVQVATSPGSNSYSTPEGVLTSWRYRSGPAAGSIQLKLFEDTGTVGEYKAVGQSPVHTLDETNKDYEFHERISVKQGNMLGLQSIGVNYFGSTGPESSDVFRRFNSTTVPIGSTGTAPLPAYTGSRIAIAATVEPDADSDGYGDISQDSCPTDKSTHDACPKPASDATGPKLTLGGKTSQKLGPSVSVDVTCNEGCSLAGNGSIATSKPKASKALALKQGALNLPAGQRGALKLKLSKKVRNKVKRALRNGRKATATVNITAKDASGNASSAQRKIKLKRR